MGTSVSVKELLCRLLVFSFFAEFQKVPVLSIETPSGLSHPSVVAAGFSKCKPKVLPNITLHKSKESCSCWIWPLRWKPHAYTLFVFLSLRQFDSIYNSIFLFSLICFFCVLLRLLSVCFFVCCLQVTAGSKAAQGDLCPGDTILAINGDSTESMTHMEAQNRIKACTRQLALNIIRYEEHEDFLTRAT